MARIEELMARGALPSDWSPALARPYAGFWRRVGAALVDGLIFLPVTLVFGVVLTGVVPALIGQLVWLAYVVSLDARGATLGKRALSVKVIDAAEQAPGVRRSLLRHVFDVAALLFVFTGVENDPPGAEIGLSLAFCLLALVDVLWMLQNDDRQTLHDKLAGTYVVHS